MPRLFTQGALSTVMYALSHSYSFIIYRAWSGLLKVKNNWLSIVSTIWKFTDKPCIRFYGKISRFTDIQALSNMFIICSHVVVIDVKGPRPVCTALSAGCPLFQAEAVVRLCRFLLLNAFEENRHMHRTTNFRNCWTKGCMRCVIFCAVSSWFFGRPWYQSG